MRKKKFLMRLALLLIFLLSLLLISSCNRTVKVKQKDNVISNDKLIESRLTDSEISLLSATGCRDNFVFDVKITDEKYKWVDLWVDYYENGEKKEPLINGGFSIDTTKKNVQRIMFSMQECNNDDEKKEKWILSYIIGKGVGSVSNIIDKHEAKVISTSSMAQDIPIVNDKTISLSVIIEKKGNGVSGVPINFFENEDEYMEQLMKNDYVYILRCKFSKNRNIKN